MVQRIPVIRLVFPTLIASVVSNCLTHKECKPSPDCPDPFFKLSTGGVTIPNKCFYFSRDDKTFVDAMIDCASLGGRLLNIMTVDEGLAVREHLHTYHPGIDFTVGYTDFIANGTITGLSGGSVPLPVFGSVPAQTENQDCLLIRVHSQDITDTETRYEPCEDTDDYICEINLDSQSCTCPY